GPPPGKRVRAPPIRPREVEGARAPGEVDVARGGRDAHVDRPVLAGAAEERGLAERRQAGVQARDERVVLAAPGYGLGPAGNAREIVGVRHTRDVAGARRRRDPDP